jgi:hypothetical protein
VGGRLTYGVVLVAMYGMVLYITYSLFVTIESTLRKILPYFISNSSEHNAVSYITVPPSFLLKRTYCRVHAML